jgi:hypothetical protein
VCSSVDRTAGTQEEQQIRVMTDFEVERGRTMVEGEKLRIENFCFILIGLVPLNRP